MPSPTLRHYWPRKRPPETDAGRTLRYALGHFVPGVDSRWLEPVNKPTSSTLPARRVNTLGQDHENALVPAAMAGDVESIAVLLEHGARVSDRALETAVHSKSTEVFRRLAAAKKLDYTSEEGGNLLIEAAAAGNAPLIRELLDRGAPVNYRQPQTQYTALLAAGAEETEIVRLLIEHGADVNARDTTGRTLLFRAASSLNTGMIELHAAHGADLNIADTSGRTALMTASDLCWYWDIEALLAHGANPLIRDRRGRTALEPNYVAPKDPKCAVSRQMLNAVIRRPGPGASR